MVKRILFFSFIFTWSTLLWSSTIVTTISSKTDWDVYLSTSITTDTQSSAGGLRLRYEDVPGDFEVMGDNPPPTYRQDWSREPVSNVTSTDVPVGSGFTYSRHITTDNVDVASPSVGVYFNTGPYAAKLQPSSLIFYIKSSYHDCTLVSGFQYPWCNLMGTYQNGLYAWPYGVNGTEQTITGSLYDAHVWPAWLAYFSSLNAGGGTGGVGYGDNYYVPVDLTWFKIQVYFDWAQERVRYYLNDHLFTHDTLFDRDTDYADGWMNFTNTGTNWYICSTCPRDHLDWYAERLDASITLDPDFSGGVEYYACTDFCKYRIRNGTAIIQFGASGLSNVTSATLAWTTSVLTDTNLTDLEGRSMLDDATKITSSVGSGVTSLIITDYGGLGDHVYPSSGWSETGDLTAWVKYDFTTPRVIKHIYFVAKLISGIYASISYVEGSNNDSTWTPITFSSTDSGSFRHYTSTGSTSYRYYRVTFTSSNANIHILSLEMREGPSSRTGSEWTGISMEYRVSTDSGGNYGSWTSLTSGGILTGATGSGNSLRIQVRPTLTTDNQKYQPIITSMTLTTNGTPPPSISGGKLTGGKQ